MAEFNLKEYLQNNILLEDKKELPKSIADKERADIEKDAKKAKGMIKVSELKAAVREMILDSMNEDEEENDLEKNDLEDDDASFDDDTTDITPEPSMDGAGEGLSDNEKEIQDALKLAYDNAIQIGDEKLADQIGNSITFFTRSHVVER